MNNSYRVDVQASNWPASAPSPPLSFRSVAFVAVLLLCTLFFVGLGTLPRNGVATEIVSISSTCFNLPNGLDCKVQLENIGDQTVTVASCSIVISGTRTSGVAFASSPDTLTIGGGDSAVVSCAAATGSQVSGVIAGSFVLTNGQTVLFRGMIT